MTPQFSLVSPRSIKWLFAMLTIALGISLLPGCGSAKIKVDDSAGQVGENLSVIADAYTKAMDKNGKPPKGPEDLKPFLPKDKDQDSLFRSVRDGEPFVIIWGTNPREGMDIKPLVIAYEKNGKGGTRMVFTAMGVMTMANADFPGARFPAGHKP